MNVLRCADFACVFLLVFGAVAAAGDERSGFTLSDDEHGMVLKMPDGRTVFRYMTVKPANTNLTANSVCCLYPVNTPSGTRAVDFAPGDHRHHRGVFLAWHAMICGGKRADFWGWGKFAPTENRVIRNRSVQLLAGDARPALLAKRAVVAVVNEWTIGEDVVIEELLTITTREQRGAFVIDLRFRLTPKAEVKLDQTAFGGFCVKARKDGLAKYVGPQGEVKLPRPHHLKPETDWPAAAWYDYVIELENGKTIGVAVIDVPGNSPSTWHNLLPIAMVNPCIAAPGEVTFRPEKPLRLGYRLVVHDGPAPTKLLNELAAECRKDCVGCR